MNNIQNLNKNQLPINPNKKFKKIHQCFKKNIITENTINLLAKSKNDTVYHSMIHRVSNNKIK